VSGFPFFSVQAWSGPLVSLVLTLGLIVLGEPAQAQVDVAAARAYAQSLDHNFWERAWVRHLEAEADRDGSIDWNYGDRQQLSELTDEYQRAIGASNGFWTNLQVQDKLQRQLLTVQPNPMMPGRPGAFRLRVLSTTTPNVLALNDGTILVTTGLLTTLETEAQLRAVLAHEVAHVVLDHALATYRSGQRRSRARNLLGSIVGGVTSIVTPGLGRRPVESTVYGLSADLATRYLDREFIAAAGLEYSRDQERAANRLAQEWLLARGESPGALHAALQALERAGVYGSMGHGASFTDNHPSSPERRDELAAVIEEEGGDPAMLDATETTPDSTYDTAIAAVLEHEAEMDLTARRFHSASDVLDRALRTQWTTPQTFLFKAVAVRNTTTGAEGVTEALALLRDAEAAASGPEPRIEAERALLRVRQGRPEAARRHLTRCREQIDELRAANDTTGAHDSLYAWAEKMETRLRE
jgi:uncharacterized membrane protein